MKILKQLLLLLSLVSIAWAQNYTITGKVTSTEDDLPIQAANVQLVKTRYGDATDAKGVYKLVNVPAGKYTIKVSCVGFEAFTKEIEVKGNIKDLNFELNPTSIITKEAVVEASRAKERETPVSFTNIGKEQLDEKQAGQDAPLLIKGTAGVFAAPTDGSGNGESQVYVRGFSQEYVQVMVNGISTNDPESNRVYWSNWGSVSSNVSNIQVQRGAGSSLYGSGSFGGSFNMVTDEADAKFQLRGQANIGNNYNQLYAIRFNSGLLFDDKFAFKLNFRRKMSDGARIGARYESWDYYFTSSFFPTETQQIKLTISGAPQRHGYSYSNHAAYFKLFGYDANSSGFLPKSLVEQLRHYKNPVTGKEAYGMLDDTREIVGPDYVNLAYNFYHKPQIELSYNWEIQPGVSSLSLTSFYSMGRGAGVSLSKAGRVFDMNVYNKLYPALPGYENYYVPMSGILGKDYSDANTQPGWFYGNDGYINDTTIAKYYLKGAYQSASYSFHKQTGVILNYNRKFADIFTDNLHLNLNLGAEFRHWRADHPGHFATIFTDSVDAAGYSFYRNEKKQLTRISQQYMFVDEQGNIVRDGNGLAQRFSRFVKQGDLKHPKSDLGNIFEWDLANDPQYVTQYRNYVGTVPQYTLFIQGNWLYEKFNIMTSLQYVHYDYTLKENMPSENATGRQLHNSTADKLGLPNAVDPDSNLVVATFEGKRNGKFYMLGQSGTQWNWYEFNLINATRSRGFWQPKFGINWNVTKNFNVFANFAHTERRVDLGVYYNQGILQPHAKDEKSNQYELSFGWKDKFQNLKLNTFYILWDNKSARIRDVSRAGEPGFDRDGNRTELVGTSRNTGFEFEGEWKLDKISKKLKGLRLSSSFTYMDNRWIKVADEAKYKRDANGNIIEKRIFNSDAYMPDGSKGVMYFEDLKNKHTASGPQTIFNITLSYKYKGFSANFSGHYFARNYVLDGEGYLPVDGYWYDGYYVYNGQIQQGKVFVAKIKNTLPEVMTFDLGLGYYTKIAQDYFISLRLNIDNVFDKVYFTSADRYGVVPGQPRTFRFNVSFGI